MEDLLEQHAQQNILLISSIHHEFLFKEKGRFETLLRNSQKKKAVPNRRRGKVKCKWAGEESSKKDKLIEELKLLICKYEKARIGYLDDQKIVKLYELA